MQLHFENTHEFETLFKRKKVKVTNAIVEAIGKAFDTNKRSALLFEITFEDVENLYEISLPRSQWKQALEQCLDHYHQLGLADEQIDTWTLLEKVKKI